MVEDVVVGLEDTVGEPIVAHELPDVFYGVELGRFRRQRQERDVVWNGQLRRNMPSGLIEDENGMRAGSNRKRDLFQMESHGLGVARGKNETGAFSLYRADGAEDVGRVRPLVVRRRRPCPALGPSAGDLVLLTDASLVLEPNLYWFAASLPCAGFVREGEEVFLKSAAASSSCA